MTLERGSHRGLFHLTNYRHNDPIPHPDLSVSTLDLIYHFIVIIDFNDIRFVRKSGRTE